MKKDVPREFLKEYEQRREGLDSQLEYLKDIMVLRLGQLNSMKGTRARLTDARVKRPAKIWKKAEFKGYAPAGAFDKIVDILGFRVVCNNLSDSDAVIEMLRQEGGVFEIKEIKDMVSKPADGFFRVLLR
jgi:ppGpp synthetase/RelA/SpoT-type nucleotidyltranferase